ncbi:hydroxyacylglutathione hydrolase [Candidatus Symbiobacter mobilis]|uniref:Hydroxyacylglutathione hydrolase n=1 Tax=Candidatus Symbiobacter mobilis CR TaxID=946483 RepID=U5N8F9_9BURK|nr:hydroxyacylglutathione hydrolase [Candidatus Symbiobacter mobilis]AGX87692.1 hydroxyacylglutathione hydrolase [Candidatus Symbiobacter mobilis CR]
MNLVPIPCLADNYAWMLWEDGRAIVVDPGDAGPVQRAADSLGVRIESILVTHHHADHTGGVHALRNGGATVLREGGVAVTVYAPQEHIAGPVVPCQDGTELLLLGLPCRVLHVPGHTAGHVAYLLTSPAEPPILFCGDTLFSGGCGRLFEGTAQQMLASLSRLAQLPEETRVCCAHEYTEGCLRFARRVEPDNIALRDYQDRVHALRSHGKPTLPSTIGLEKAVNPFLRTHVESVQRAVRAQDPDATDPVAVFAALRRWKDRC